MAAGPMSLVAPLSATSAAVPVLWALARGGHVDAVQAAGIVLAFAGVILASGPELREGALVSRSTLLLTLISAIGFGLYYIFFALGSATSVYGTVLAQRAGGVLILAPVALRGIRAGTGPLRRLAFGASAVGLLLWSGFGDVTVIDGLMVNGSARLVGWFAGVVRWLQSGFIYHYAFSMIIGVFVLLTLFGMALAS